MIRINDKYSIDVEHRDNGQCWYSLYDEDNDCVFEREGSTAFTSSEASMIEMGLAMINSYENLGDNDNICNDCGRIVPEEDMEEGLFYQQSEGGGVCEDCKESESYESCDKCEYYEKRDEMICVPINPSEANFYHKECII